MSVQLFASRIKPLRLTLVYFAALTLLVGCWGVSVSNTDNQCVPPDYPTMQQVQRRSDQIYTHDTSDSIEKVQTAYSTKLQPASWQEYSGETLWRSKAVGNGSLYECFFGDGYEVEVGCVYLQVAKDKTRIQLVWELAEGGSGCSSILSLPREK